MPFHLFFLPSYERCLKKLGTREKYTAGLIVFSLNDYFQAGSTPSSKPHMIEFEKHSYRLVFKKLRGSIWEAYVEGRVRVLTMLEKDIHYLVFAGNHDQVQQFLKET